MSGSNGSGIFHYAWSRGLAAVVEAQACRTAAVFGPGGWEQGQPGAVLPSGVPPGAEEAHLALPEWLAEQIAGLQFSAGGLHTQFVRLSLLLERLRLQPSGGVVLVLGERPSVYLVAGGQVTQYGEGAATPDEASGWIVVFSGGVRVPAARPPAAEEPPAPEEPPAAEEPRAPVEPPAAEEARAAVAEPPGVREEPCAADDPCAADETYFVPAGVRNSLPEEVAAGVLEVAGPEGRAVPGLLDGTRTIAAVAAMVGLTTGQARAVVGVLMAQRLAFRYVGRSRQAPRSGSGGTCARALDGL